MFFHTLVCPYQHFSMTERLYRPFEKTRVQTLCPPNCTLKGELTISSTVFVLTYFVYNSKPNASVKTANSYCIQLKRYEHLKNPCDDVIAGVAFTYRTINSDYS